MWYDMSALVHFSSPPFGEGRGVKIPGSLWLWERSRPAGHARWPFFGRYPVNLYRGSWCVLRSVPGQGQISVYHMPHTVDLG